MVVVRARLVRWGTRLYVEPPNPDHYPQHSHHTPKNTPQTTKIQPQLLPDAPQRRGARRRLRPLGAIRRPDVAELHPPGSWLLYIYIYINIYIYYNRTDLIWVFVCTCVYMTCVHDKLTPPHPPNAPTKPYIQSMTPMLLNGWESDSHTGQGLGACSSLSLTCACHAYVHRPMYRRRRSNPRTHSKNWTPQPPPPKKIKQASPWASTATFSPSRIGTSMRVRRADQLQRMSMMVLNICICVGVGKWG